MALDILLSNDQERSLQHFVRFLEIVLVQLVLLKCRF